MKCPYCQKELPVYFIRTIIRRRLAMPTKRQMEAYRLVAIQGLTQEQVNEYVRHGGALCPFCGTANIEGGEVESEHDGAWQSVKCNQCGATWNDVHRLVAVDWHEGPVYHCLDAEPDGPDYKALAEKLAEACEMALHDQYGELVPDGWDVAEGLRAALAEYKAATEGGAA